MLKVGMVGVGCISGIYLKNFSEVFRDVKLIGVCDLIRSRAEEAKEKYNIEKIYDTMYDMFADKEIDIVINLTRPYQHYDVTKAALLAGKHVYSEKPLAASLKEGLELCEIAKEKGLYLGGAPDTFMGAAIQTARKLIEDGLIGKPVGGRFVMTSHGVESWHPDPDFYYQYGGGPLFDMGPYYITAMINLLGGAKSVFGYAHTTFDTRLITAKPHEGEIIKVNTPTHIESFINLDSGITVSLLTSFDVYQSKQTRIEIYGTKGTMYVPDPNCFCGEIEFFNGETGKTEMHPMTFDYSENSRCLGLDDMAAAIEQKRPARASWHQTLHVLEIMQGVLDSAKSGEVYELKTKFEKQPPMDPTLPHGYL